MDNRRYSDEEIAAIFQKASEGPLASPPQAAHEEGMTLAELQEIGREVGISPEAVDRAARSLDVRPRGGMRKFIGLPIGVERTIDLGRKLTDDEWERLVVELREVFAARGVVSASGSFRQWTNGNLQALLEPTANGHRLRISTMKDSARLSIAFGTVFFVLGAIIAAAGAYAGRVGDALPPIIMSLTGVVMIANGTLRLPRWARLRASQMDAITSRLALDTATLPATQDPKRLPPV
jgi:hypothetical protein